MGKTEESLKHFLIVDDLSMQRVALEAAIREVVPNSIFIEAESLVQANRIIESKSNTIDLAIIDMKLEGSGKEGIELIKILGKSAHRKKPRVILITAYPDEKNEILAKEAGANAYISKLDVDVTKKLQHTVKRLLEG